MLGWSMIRRRSPSTACACPKPSWSRTLFMPWSGITTAVTIERTSSSSPMARRVATQSVGRLKVGMPMVTAARPGASVGACHPPECTISTESSVLRSNQYQPPSSNGVRSSSMSS